MEKTTKPLTENNLSTESKATEHTIRINSDFVRHIYHRRLQQMHEQGRKTPNADDKMVFDLAQEHGLVPTPVTSATYEIKINPELIQQLLQLKHEGVAAVVENDPNNTLEAYAREKNIPLPNPKEQPIRFDVKGIEKLAEIAAQHNDFDVTNFLSVVNQAMQQDLHTRLSQSMSR